MHFGASKIIFKYAEVLRKDMTNTEKIIWDGFSKNQLGGKVRTQHPMEKYMADFIAMNYRL